MWIDIDPDLLARMQQQNPDLEGVIRDAMRHDDTRREVEQEPGTRYEHEQ